MMYIMVSKENCPYCDKAKQLITSTKGGSVVHYSLEESRWILDLFKKAGLKTVPQIWTFGGEHIGGYTELKEYLNDNPKEV